MGQLWRQLCYMDNSGDNSATWDNSDHRGVSAYDGGGDGEVEAVTFVLRSVPRCGHAR